MKLDPKKTVKKPLPKAKESNVQPALQQSVSIFYVVFTICIAL